MIDPTTLAQRLEAMAADPSWRRFMLDKEMAALCAGALRSIAPSIAASAIDTRSAETEGLDPKDDGPTGEAGDAQGASQ